MQHTVGSRREGSGRVVSGRSGEAGELLFGPYVPMRPGRWTARFRLAAGPGHASGPFGLVDIAVGSGAEVVVRKELTEELLPFDGVLHEVSVPFVLDSTELSVEFRAQSYGAIPMSAVLHVDAEREEPAVDAGHEHRVESARA